MCSSVSTKALSSLNIKRIRLCFGCPRSYLREPPGHTPPAFLFLSSTMSNSREALSFRFVQPTKNPPVPLSGNTGVSASCILNSRRNIGSCLQRRVPQWPLYRSAHAEVSSVCWKIFAIANKPIFISAFGAGAAVQNPLFSGWNGIVFDCLVVISGDGSRP
jgi:hypothetical protein